MNQYDQAEINVRALLDRPLKTRPRYSSPKEFGAIWLQKIKFYVLAGLYQTGIWRRLVLANLAISWFTEFKQYWIQELGMRRIDLPDFFYLRSAYRARFQAINVNSEQEKSGDDFLTPWQKAETVYLLFAYVYKLALHPIAVWQIKKFVNRGDEICEYGCGVAPISSNLAKFYSGRNLSLTAIDIPNIMLHYARWRLQNFKNVTVEELDPANDTPLNQQYNLITCLTVLEHLPRPLPIVQHLHHQLKPGGYFVFDYIKSQGEGLDTIGSLQQRQEVIDFIRNNFVVKQGKIPSDNESNIKTVICVKK